MAQRLHRKAAQHAFEDILTTNRQYYNFHQDDWAAFFKDDWNVTPNLTLNMGVRWDVYGVPYEPNGLATRPKDFNFLGISGPGGQLTEIITVGKGSLNPDQQLYSEDWNNIAPSFGFSYRVPWIDRTTVVRGGYGVNYVGAPTERLASAQEPETELVADSAGSAKDAFAETLYERRRLLRREQ